MLVAIGAIKGGLYCWNSRSSSALGHSGVCKVNIPKPIQHMQCSTYYACECLRLASLRLASL